MEEKRSMWFIRGIVILFFMGAIFTGGKYIYAHRAKALSLLKDPPRGYPKTRVYTVRIINRHHVTLQGLEDSLILESDKIIDLKEYDTLKVTHYGE